MPNSVYSRLVITGAEEAVDRFVNLVRSEDLDHDGEPYVLDFARHVPPPADVGDRLRNWMDMNWGTKQPMSAEISDRAPDKVTYTFTTAWTPPVPWLKHASAREPALSFLHEFVEEFEQIWGRNRWEHGAMVQCDDIEPRDLAWAYESDGEDDDDEYEDEDERIDPDAADTAVDVLATVADRVLESQGIELARATGLERLVPITAALGDAARISQLMIAARRGYGVEPSDAQFALGGDWLIDAFCTQIAVAGAHALNTAAAYRVKAEKDIGFHTALHRVFDETAEGAYDGEPAAITGPSPADWLAQVLDYLGDSVNLLHAETLWDEGEDLPGWVRQWGSSGAEAASTVFLLLASNCLCAIASLCPGGIDAEGIDLLGPEDQLRAVQDPRGPASQGRYRTSRRRVG